MSRPAILFFLFAYTLSWCVYIPLALQDQDVLNGVPDWLYLAGAYGPAAFIVTG